MSKSRASASCPRCPRTRRSTNWLAPQISAGELSATTRLKQDFGLGHCEGRGWRGFHRHASLSIAAYGFLMAERLIADKPVGGKENFIERQVPPLPEDYILRGSPARAAARGPFDHDIAVSPQLLTDRPSWAVPLLRQGKRKASLVTQ